MIKTNNVKKEREKQGLTQFELAKKADITQGIISQIENEKIYPYPGWRERLSRALEVSEDKLFPGGDNDE